MNKSVLVALISMGILVGCTAEVSDTIKGFSADMSPAEFAKNVESFTGESPAVEETDQQAHSGQSTEDCGGCLTTGGAEIASVFYRSDKSSYASVGFRVKEGEGKTLVDSITKKYGDHDSYEVIGATVYFKWDLTNHQSLKLKEGGHWMQLKKDLTEGADLSDF